MFTIDYFIEKFKNIPTEKWFTATFQNPENSLQKCALGHCGCKWDKNTGFFPKQIETPESKALGNLFLKKWPENPYVVSEINDGRHPMFLQQTPKERILAALEWLKT